MPNEEVTKDLTLRLPVELYELLVERAKAEERSIAATVRVAIRHYLEPYGEARDLEYPNPPRRPHNPLHPLPRDIPPS